MKAWNRKTTRIFIPALLVLVLVGIGIGGLKRWKTDRYRQFIREGLSYYDQGEFTKAEKFFRKAGHFRPASQEVEFQLGRIALRRERYGEAQKYFDSILLKNPNDEKAELYRAFLYLETYHIPEAVPVFLKDLKKRPGDPMLHNALAWAYALEYNAAEAEKEFKLSIQLSTNGPPGHSPYGGLAFVYIYWDKFKKAEEVISEGLSKDPKDVLVIAALATLKTETGNYAEALQALDRVRHTDRETPRVLERRCFVLLSEGKLDEAEQTAERMRLSAGGDAYAMLDLGLIAEKRRKYDEALKMIKESIKRFPGNMDAYKALGDFYLNRGQKDLALKAYQKVTDTMAPDTLLVKEIKAALKSHA